MGMKALTGEMQRPSEGLDIKNPYGAMAIDAISDPANLIGVGELSGLSKLGKEKALAKLAASKESFIQANPLISTIPKALQHGLYKDLGNAAAYTVADKVAAATYKLPILDNIYKDLAYKVGSHDAGFTRNIHDIKTIFNKKGYTRGKFKCKGKSTVKFNKTLKNKK